MTDSRDIYREIALHQRAQLAEIEYAIERRAADLETLKQRREDVVRSLTEIDEILTRGT